MYSEDIEENEGNKCKNNKQRLGCDGKERDDIETHDCQKSRNELRIGQNERQLVSKDIRMLLVQARKIKNEYPKSEDNGERHYVNGKKASCRNLLVPESK
jgi:hypothetical protein